MSKNIKTRIQNKHDIEANWLQAENFKPLAGEIIIYDPDSTHSSARVKIGDGNTLVNNLPFAVEKNQNAFSNIIVGSTTVAADKATDSLTLVAGNNITITPDATNDKITIAATNTTYNTGTSTTSGLTKLYTATGSKTDGTMTQSAITAAINDLISCGTTDPGADTTSQFYFKYATN
jgi:hypothetical protein